MAIRRQRRQIDSGISIFMIAIDTNILVYAHREDAPFHLAAISRVAALAQGERAWAIPWPCLCEFYAIVTHPRIYRPPSSVKAAIDQIEAWVESPSLTLLSESVGQWSTLRELLLRGRIAGPIVHDAKIAALCISQQVSELWSADRDFGRFPGLSVRNPLID